MGKNRLKTVTAGRLVYAVCYSQATAADEKTERQAKTRLSSAARQRLNFRAAWQKLELLLAANFGRRDWFVTLTYDDDHLPPDRKRAGAEMGKFLRALRSQRKAAGKELCYVYNIEEMPDEPGGSKRLHHHAFINCAGDPAEVIAALWGRGQVFIEPILDGPNDSYEARARYFVKERQPGELGRKTGLRAWIPSRNLRKPEVSSELVPETVTITAPPGAFILDRHGEQNCYGAYSYIKYLLPETRRKRRRRI
jgi:hypothetical protein